MKFLRNMFLKKISFSVHRLLRSHEGLTNGYAMHKVPIRSQLAEWWPQGNQRTPSLGVAARSRHINAVSGYASFDRECILPALFHLGHHGET